MTIKKYDIYFSDEVSTDHKGFALKTEEKAINMAEDMLAKRKGFVKDYAGGMISVRDNDGNIVWSKPIDED